MTSKARGLANLGNAYDDGALSNRNLVINGAMQVAQRGTSFNPQGTNNGEGYTVDRFAWVRREETGSGFTFDATITQDADSPSGLDKSLKVVADTTQSSLSGSENALITTKFEGQDLQRFGWGATGANAVTLSFWVKSNKTGTYCVQTRYNQNTDSGLFEYNVSTSGTWEYKTITIPANTSVSFNSNNTLEMEVMFHLAAGPSDIASASSSTGTNYFRVTSNQVNFFDAASNYWQITGVQLEVGDTATPFEHRSYGDEIQRCMRFYEKQTGLQSCEQGIVARTTTTREHVEKWAVVKRATPTVTFSTQGYYCYSTGTIDTGTGTGVSFATVHGALLGTTGCAARVAGDTVAVERCVYEADAEL